MKNILIVFSLMMLSEPSVLAQKQNDEKSSASEHKKTIQQILYPPKTIVTDRPGASESSQTVPFKYFQIETGTSFSSDISEPYQYNNFNYNTAVLKYGIGHNVELRVITNYLAVKQTYLPTDYEYTQSGLQPLTLGTKVTLGINGNFFKNTALLAHISLNSVATPNFRTRVPAHNILMSNSTNLNDRIDMTFNLGAGWDGFSSEISGLYTLNFGYGISDRTGVFIEIFGDWPQRRGMSANLDAGITFLASYRFQFDISGGVGLSEEATDWFVSGGISYMLKAFK